MFKNAFSFDGRIRRTEYGISRIISVVAMIIAAFSTRSFGDLSEILYYILLIPVIWFWLAQSAKRCHDLGNSGWFQLIPFYEFWMLFVNSEPGDNGYGPNPKEIENESVDVSEIESIGKHLE